MHINQIISYARKDYFNKIERFSYVRSEIYSHVWTIYTIKRRSNDWKFSQWYHVIIEFVVLMELDLKLKIYKKKLTTQINHRIARKIDKNKIDERKLQCKKRKRNS